MPEWLKTGEMIDLLKDGQLAKNNQGNFILRKSYGFIWCEEDGSYLENKYLPINDITLDMKWKLIPEKRFVSFEDGNKEIKNVKEWSTMKDKCMHDNITADEVYGEQFCEDCSSFVDKD